MIGLRPARRDGARTSLRYGGESRHGAFQALGAGQVPFRQTFVARVMNGMALVVLRQSRGRNIIASAPKMNLFIAVSFCRCCFIEAL